VGAVRRSVQKVFGGEILGFIMRYKVERHGYKLDMAADGTCLGSCIYSLEV
jgi:hypothetical protein